MTPEILERKMPAKTAGFVRQTLHSDRLEGVLRIPEALKHRLVEVILLPLDDNAENLGGSGAGGATIDRFAGAWAGAPLVREGQGAYEAREELE